MPTMFRTAALVLAALTQATAAQCPSFGPYYQVGTLPTNLLPAGTLSEVSGMVASRQQPGVLWVHDDAGHGPIVVGLRSNGAVVQQYSLSGVTNTDWEDIAIGPGPILGRDYLYLADSGNNNLTRTVFALVRIAEPDPPSSPGAPIALAGAETFPFVYPGPAPDTEALFVDPVDGTPYLISKDDTQAVLYRYPLPLTANVTRTLVQETTLTLPQYKVTGADITADGSRIHVRTHRQMLSFARPRGTSTAQALAATPCVLFTGNLGQVESVALEPDGSGLFTVAEGVGSPILRAGALAPATFAAWWNYDQGAPGLLGQPGIGPSQPPVLGGAATTLHLHTGSPFAGALCGLGVLPVPYGLRPLGNGFVLADPVAVFGFGLNGLGRGSVALPAAPNDLGLAGFVAYAQGFVLDPWAPSGISMTRGLALRLGP